MTQSTYDGAGASADACAEATEERHVKLRLSLACAAAHDVPVRRPSGRSDEGARRDGVTADPASLRLNGLLQPRRSRGCSDEGSRRKEVPIDPGGRLPGGLLPCRARYARFGQPYRFASDRGTHRMRGRADSFLSAKWRRRDTQRGRDGKRHR